MAKYARVGIGHAHEAHDLAEFLRIRGFHADVVDPPADGVEILVRKPVMMRARTFASGLVSHVQSWLADGYPGRVSVLFLNERLELGRDGDA
jgi:hypothetical protein